MNPPGSNEHLSRITTLGTMLRKAHAGPEDQAATARRELIGRYHGAVYPYLLGALRDEEAALEQFQEFSVRFLLGDFRRAAPERGRFRDFLKTARLHLIADYHRARRERPPPLPPDLAAPATPGASDDDFLPSWREELLNRAWPRRTCRQPNRMPWPGSWPGSLSPRPPRSCWPIC